ncbi:MAG: thiamine phosphate synthase [Alphaproteobacteria bacterium]|jgi:thiamine-phosphate pyrophosphorylase|nr:thiamine phosphate synthase [Alphaproteobacteria bacterium]
MGSLSEARGKLARVAARLNARHGRGLPSLILMTDDARDVDWVEAVSALPRGAAVIVRHREPHAREALARRLRGVAVTRGVKMLIADDEALAVRVGADGMHVPQRRAARIAAIKASHPRWLVTASAHGVASVAAARDADAVIVAPVFATATHPGAASLGAVRFALLARGALRVYALGGVDAVSVQRLTALRISGVALIGGWVEG